MDTYLEWDRTVLETCWDDIEFISAHRYSTNAADNTPDHRVNTRSQWSGSIHPAIRFDTCEFVTIL